MGVDIFFVISGYLISSIIFTSLMRGNFSFPTFYTRRVKRIFPALLLVLSCSLAAGWEILLSDQYKELGKQIAGGAGFMSNFLFWDESGYFDSAAETKPLLHLWSLGIEEQFYIFWPCLLWIFHKYRMKPFLMTAILAFLSMAINVLFVKTHAVAIFYSPLSRSWELFAGAMLAISATRIPEHKIKLAWPSWANHACSVLGTVLIASSLFYGSPRQPFPGWLALLPVSGAVLCIAAGPTAFVSRVLLSNRLVVWFGQISFPLYLWHWPLLAFAHVIANGEIPATERAALMATSVALAWMTVVFIERPIRHGAAEQRTSLVLLSLIAGVGLTGYVCYRQDGVILGKQSNLAMSDENIEIERQHYWSGRLDNDYAKNNPKVILYGDSQAYDVFRALSNDPRMGLKLFKTSHQCSAFFSRSLDAPEAMQKQCNDEFSQLLDAPELKTADTLIYTHLWSERNEIATNHLIGVRMLLQKNPHLRILFFGHKPLLGENWGASINTITRDHHSQIGMNDYLNGIKNISDESYVKKMAASAGAEFVDVQKIFCEGQCVFYAAGTYSYFDFDHWTEAGARIFYERFSGTILYESIAAVSVRAKPAPAGQQEAQKQLNEIK